MANHHLDDLESIHFADLRPGMTSDTRRFLDDGVLAFLVRRPFDDATTESSEEGARAIDVGRARATRIRRTSAGARTARAIERFVSRELESLGRERHAADIRPLPANEMTAIAAIVISAADAAGVGDSKYLAIDLSKSLLTLTFATAETREAADAAGAELLAKMCGAPRLTEITPATRAVETGPPTDIGPGISNHSSSPDMTQLPPAPPSIETKQTEAQATRERLQVQASMERGEVDDELQHRVSRAQQWFIDVIVITKYYETIPLPSVLKLKFYCNRYVTSATGDGPTLYTGLYDEEKHKPVNAEAAREMLQDAYKVIHRMGTSFGQDYRQANECLEKLPGQDCQRSCALLRRIADHACKRAGLHEIWAMTPEQFLMSADSRAKAKGFGSLGERSAT